MQQPGRPVKLEFLQMPDVFILFWDPRLICCEDSELQCVPLETGGLLLEHRVGLTETPDTVPQSTSFPQTGLLHTSAAFGVSLVPSGTGFYS